MIKTIISAVMLLTGVSAFSQIVTVDSLHACRTLSMARHALETCPVVKNVTVVVVGPTDKEFIRVRGFGTILYWTRRDEVFPETHRD